MAQEWSCPNCGKVNPPQLTACGWCRFAPVGLEQPVAPAAPAQEAGTDWGALGLIILIVVVGLGVMVVGDHTQRTTPVAAPAATQSESLRKRWDAVADLLVESGSGMITVNAFDPKHPDWMQINVAGALATDLTDYQARKLAVTASTRLGTEARVTVVDDTGKIRARARYGAASN